MPQGDHNISSTQNDQPWLVNYAYVAISKINKLNQADSVQ